MNLSAMLFNVPFSLAFFLVMVLVGVKSWLYQTTEFFMNFLLLMHIGPHWQQLYCTLVACFSCLLQCNCLLLLLFILGGRGGCLEMLTVHVFLTSKFQLLCSLKSISSQHLFANLRKKTGTCTAFKFCIYMQIICMVFQLPHFWRY